MWYYKLTNSFLQAYVIPAIVRKAKLSLVTRILHYTEAATDHELCYYYYTTIDELLNPETRASARAVDLGGPRVYQGGPKFEIKHKNRSLQKSNLVNWGGLACRLGPPGPPGLPWRRPYLKQMIGLYYYVCMIPV